MYHQLAIYVLYFFFFKDTIFMWHSLNFVESLRPLRALCLLAQEGYGSFAYGGGNHEGFHSGRNSQHQGLCLTHVFH